MEYVITFPDIWTALRFAQLYQDHLYKGVEKADIMLYPDGGYLIPQHWCQRYFKIKKPIADLTELSDFERRSTSRMVKLYSNNYQLDKVALIMKFSVKDFYASFAPNWAIDLTDVRHKYRTYAEYKGEPFDMHGYEYYGGEELVYPERSLLVPIG